MASAFADGGLARKLGELTLASKYHVTFQPSGPGGATPQIAINDQKTTRTLPCLAPPGQYTVVWVLTGDAGGVAPGLIVATDLASGKTLPPLPIGFDSATEQPIRIASGASVAHDFAYGLTLP